MMNNTFSISSSIKSILFSLLFIPILAYGQISEGGTPPSFQHSSLLKSGSKPQVVPIDFSVEDLKSVDEWQVSQGSPLRVSTILPVNYNLTEAGEWLTLDNGQEICQLKIKAEGAIALMLYYSRFILPEGAHLFIYNSDKTQVLGAYTQATNPKNREFATEFVAGDDLVLEYVPAESGEAPEIIIEGIGYGYNHLYVTRSETTTKSASGTCQVNINCEEGANWQNEKKGVCHMTQRIGNSAFICSGSLINNTAGDFKPYILSTFHCSQDGDAVATASELNQWTFQFNMELEGCSNSSLSTVSRTMVGCQRIAFTTLNAGSDGLLLLLNQNVPNDYNVYYNGWDRRENAPNSGVSIHHPQGDPKKISTYNKTATSSTFNDGKGTIGTKNAFWNVNFIATANGHSITEGGSSGSPLFNENKLVVGSLTGGNSSCAEPDGSNLYGKLSYHWNQYPTDSTRMDIYLDPVGKGSAETLAGTYGGTSLSDVPGNLQATYSDKKVTLSWQKPQTTQTISKYNIYRNDTLKTNTTALQYTDANPPAGKPTYRVSAVYSDGSESQSAYTAIAVNNYLPPTDLSVKRTNTTDLTLTWKAPVYTQSIYWGNFNTDKWSVGLDGGSPFYFGQFWTSEEIAPFHNNKITSIYFFPNDGPTYELYITQGDHNYSQILTDLKGLSLNNIALVTPFVINGNNNLIISIRGSNYTSKSYPALVDAGPALDGKGDILSTDGSIWYSLHENNEGLDNNFLIAASVSSEEGTLSTTSAENVSIQQGTVGENVLIKSITDEMKVKSSEQMTTRSSFPAAFPTVTGYEIYRDNSKIATVAATPTQYVDKNVTGSDHIYKVVALYDDGGSEPSSPVANEKYDISQEEIAIYPTVFSSQVRVNGSDQLKKIEILSATGQLVLQIEAPSETIRTANLSAGIYFFRLYAKDGTVKVIRGIKK